MNKYEAINYVKVKASPIYDPYVEEVPIREDTCPGPSALAGRVGQFLSSPPLSPQRFHRVPICCWVDSERASNQWLEVGLEPWSSA